MTVTLNFYNVFSYTLGGGQNGLSVLLQSLQHAYTKQTLQTSYKSSTCKAAVKTDILNFYRLGDGHFKLFGGESPTRMAAVLSKLLQGVKNELFKFYKPPKRLVAVKTESSTSKVTDSPNFY